MLPASQARLETCESPVRIHLEFERLTNILALVPVGFTAPVKSEPSVRYIFMSDALSRIIFPSMF